MCLLITPAAAGGMSRTGGRSKVASLASKSTVGAATGSMGGMVRMGSRGRGGGVPGSVGGATLPGDGSTPPRTAESHADSHISGEEESGEQVSVAGHGRGGLHKRMHESMLSGGCWP